MCWVSTTCFNSTAVEAEGIYDKNMRRKFIVIGEIFFPEFIITFFKKYISGKIFPSQLIILPGSGLGSQKITKFKIFSLKMSILEKERSLYLACYCHHHFCAVR